MNIPLRTIKDTLPGCLAVGLIDLRGGALLETCADDDDARESLERACAAAQALLASQDARAVAAGLARARAGAGERQGSRAAVRGAGDEGFQEIVVRAGDLVHVIQRCGGAEPRAVLAICAPVTNLGRVIAEARGLGADVNRGSDAQEP